MRIVVTNPPWDGTRAGSRWPTKSEFRGYIPYPVMLAGGVSSLRNAGHEVIFLDAIAMRMRMRDLPDFVARVQAIKPELIIQEISTPSIVDDRVIGEQLAAIAPVAVTGPHATFFAARMLDDWPFLHAVLQGEIERNSVALADAMERRCYGFDAAKSLDEYPIPAQQNLYLYRDVPGPTGGVTYQTWASRGCPWRCRFCIEPFQATGKPSHRVKSGDYLARECSQARENFPSIDGVYLDGPTENVTDRRSREIADAMYSINMPFGMMTRFDTNSLETWDYMIDRGLFYVKGGVESANQRLVDDVGKKLNLQSVRETVAHLKRRLPPRSVHMTTMFGIPGETKDTVRETLAFIEEMGVHHQESYMAPVPGTAYWADAADTFPVEELAMAGKIAPGNPDVACWVRDAKHEMGMA